MKEAQLAPTTTARIVATTTGISTQNFGPRPPEVFAVDKPTKSPQNSFPCVIFNDLRCRPCVPSHCKYVIVPEKAGGGGSTPSLVTTFQSTCPDLVALCQSAFAKRLEGSFRSWLMVNKLGRRDCSSVRSQSAFMAENRG